MGTVDTSGGGFTIQSNTTADPRFADRANGNFAMGSTSPCAAIAGDVQAAVDGTPSNPTTTAPATTTTTAPATTTTTAPATTTTTAPATTTTTAPAGSLALGPVRVSTTFNSAAINWATNIPADSQVDLWTSSSTTATYTTITMTLNHSILVPRLARGTAYAYRVRSKDTAGRSVVSPNLSFVTRP